MKPLLAILGWVVVLAGLFCLLWMGGLAARLAGLTFLAILAAVAAVGAAAQ